MRHSLNLENSSSSPFPPKWGTVTTWVEIFKKGGEKKMKTFYKGVAGVALMGAGILLIAGMPIHAGIVLLAAGTAMVGEALAMPSRRRKRDLRIAETTLRSQI